MMRLMRPHWQAPHGVHALATTRMGGCSNSPYDSLNLGDHVGDSLESVQENRRLLRMQLPSDPLWMRQVHGIAVSTPHSRSQCTESVIEADAIVTRTPNEVLVILTADCLPVLFAAKDGSVVGASHAGWRGLCGGVIEETLKEMLSLCDHLAAGDVLAWLGPAIGPDAFEVGEDVYEAFASSGVKAGSKDFVPIVGKSGKYLANLYSLATARLRSIGIHQISGGEMCTYHDKQDFFSYRRDGATGRSASLIWISE
ncbi:MAG: peptidoglycan editing factor PgeF [Polynucleobacter sp.]